jgi:lipoyl(octanoyl) transferase
MPVKFLGKQPYQDCFNAMKIFTQNRTESTTDEIWVVEHPPVYTQGLNGKPEHLLSSNIETVQTDRGGQVTYHGEGQLIIYLLIDLRRASLGVKELVHIMEQAIINFLADYQIQANAREDAPGVYVKQQKIASLGLKIKKHCSYHGLALNIDMDLSPFQLINPCGLQGMQMTQLKEQINKNVKPPSKNIVEKQLLTHLTKLLPTISL